MKVDNEKVLILIKGKEETREIVDYEHDLEKNKMKIRYKSGWTYLFSNANVRIVENPKTIDLNGNAAYIDGVPVYAPKRILDFGGWIRIINENGKVITVRKQAFTIVNNGLKQQTAGDVVAYLKDISQYTSKEGIEETFLEKEMEQMKFVHSESVLNSFLNTQVIERRYLNGNKIIFPFRFNLSQKAALENALSNSISVIDGPPGTGKTQTILNIIANLVAVHGKSVAVVSNNNEAVKNVLEKMQKQGYGFLNALLGKESNQKEFFLNMPEEQMEGWDCIEEKFELETQVEKLNIKLNGLLKRDRERKQLQQELRAWLLEQEHFEEYYARQEVEEIDKLPLMNASTERIIEFLAETSLDKDKKVSDSFIFRLKLLFKYGIFDYRKLKEHDVAIFLSMQREFYRKQISQLQIEIENIDAELENASFEQLLKQHQEISEKFFRKCLYDVHRGLTKTEFSKRNYKEKFQKFIKKYPIILSTTHALRRSIPQNYLLDYVIIDEASQVDLLIGVLVFSCCRNVIIVGDEKQLQQIVDKDIKEKIKTIPSRDEYDYFTHSILTSVLKLYKEIPRTILREHYRCHPRIIEFCNQKYYQGQLIAYTEENLSEDALTIYKTVEGNHMRRVTRGEKTGNYNQRELDVIMEEVLKNPFDRKINEKIGVVTPYRKQANRAMEFFTNVLECDTVHKYQGREVDMMIMSTVLDSSWRGKMGMDFVDNPNMVNVAVSRAVKRFVLVTDHELFFENGKEISDLIKYIQYNTLDENIIESEVISVFDLLYKKYSPKLNELKKKMKKNKKYKSEEVMRVLLEEILAEMENAKYSFSQGILLRNLLNSTDELTTDELRFVNNRASLDFVIFYKQNKKCALVIEVDGFEFHENNPEQLRRDALKNAILKKYNIPLLRLASNGSREKERIRKMLDVL